MSKGGRPKVTLTLNEAERQKLEAWSRGPKTSQPLALRARIILVTTKVWTIRTPPRSSASTS
jgi:hypothetical protein